MVQHQTRPRRRNESSFFGTHRTLDSSLICPSLKLLLARDQDWQYFWDSYSEFGHDGRLGDRVGRQNDGGDRGCNQQRPVSPPRRLRLLSG